MVDESVTSSADAWRYRAFLSYSRVDDRAAKWLHKSLENYVLPKGLVERSSYLSKTRNWFVPIFRDRTDLSSGGDLVEKLREALEQSQFLILLCSPSSAQSKIVNAEVEHFVSNGRLESVFPIIVSGEPYSNDPETECIPPALREHNIIAADMRDIKLENGKQIGDGRDGAKFKLIAGMLGVSLDNLLQRERRKANRRAAFQTALSFVFLALAAVAGGAAWMAYLSEQEAQRQRATAEASSDFLVDMFDSGVPRLQNPENITARMILDRGARRINEQFAEQPELKATLTSNIARAFSDLCATEAGVDLVETSDVMTVQGGEGAVRSLILLSRMYIQVGNLDKANEAVSRAFAILEQFDTPNFELEGYAWESRAMIAEDQYDFETALASFQTAINSYEKVSPLQPRLLAAPLSNRAWAVALSGDPQQAEQDLLLARELIEQSGRPSRLRVARIGMSLAQVATMSGDYDSGWTYFQPSFETFVELLDENHPTLGEQYQLKGDFEWQREGPAVARLSYLKALSIFENSDLCNGDFYSQTGQVYLRLAELDIEAEAYEAALKNVVMAEQAMNRAEPVDEFELQSLQTVRAEILYKLGNTEEANEVCSAALVNIQDMLGGQEATVQEYFEELCEGIRSGTR